MKMDCVVSSGAYTIRDEHKLRLLGIWVRLVVFGLWFTNVSRPSYKPIQHFVWLSAKKKNIIYPTRDQHIRQIIVNSKIHKFQQLNIINIKNLRFALGTARRRQLHHLGRALIDQEERLVVDGRIAAENQLRLRNGIKARLDALDIFAASHRARVVLENVFVVLCAVDGRGNNYKSMRSE